MLAVVDYRISPQAKGALERMGHLVLALPPHPSLPVPVSAHPDMLLFFASDCIFCTKSYQSIAKNELERLYEYTKKPLCTVEGVVSECYPNDILLNAAPIGKRLFCNVAHTARELAAHPAYEIVNVRQGYAKCSTLPVGEHALITEDASIARAAQQTGLDVLQVESRAVTLKGYDTGFLGGAASFSPYVSIPQILFCGNLDRHPNSSEIRQFCNSHGIEPISLSNEALTDVGTIFLLPME